LGIPLVLDKAVPTSVIASPMLFPAFYMLFLRGMTPIRFFELLF
jgi:hypothetical protein